MAYVIKFLSLQKSELEYEVELRGGSEGSVQELRKQIVKLGQQLPSEDILESHLGPAEDLLGIRECLVKSFGYLKSLRQKFDKNLFARTETLLHHIYHRINRISSVSEVEADQKNCQTSFDSQYKELLALQPQNQMKSTTTSLTTESTATAVSVTCDRNLTSEITKLKFSGKSCVRSFILKVEEFVLSRGISYDKILSLAFEIFTDDALHWYRCNKDKAQSWNDLCDLLKEDFSNSDYDYRLSAEIRSRTQGENENITIYLSIMHGMFSRLNRPLSEDDKLEILLHNIRPCYASTLSASPEIKTMDTLKLICRNYENIQTRFSLFHEPPKVSPSTIAPEFAYKPSHSASSSSHNKYPNYQKNSNYNNTNPSTTYQKTDNPYQQKNIPVAALATTSSKTVFCPRCRTDDHSLRNCKQERFLICFKCGKKGDWNDSAIELIDQNSNFNPTEWKNWLSFISTFFTYNAVASIQNKNYTLNKSRPYIRDKPIIGLLDTGSSTTILGNGCHEHLLKAGFELEERDKVEFVAAGGDKLYSIGMMSMDLVGPLPVTRKQNTFLLVLTCCFSKYCMIFPIRRATAEIISHILEEKVFLVHGIPSTLLMDNGRQFTSNTMRHLFSTYKIPNIYYTPLYTPQVNMVERYNKTIITAVSTFIEADHRTWDTNIPKIQFALNSAVNEVTGYTPSFLVFGRELVSCGSHYLDTDLESNIIFTPRDNYAENL
ncbi:Retrotransposable element, partial [Operophtera brumata]